MSKRPADRTGANRPWRDKARIRGASLASAVVDFSPSWEDSSSGKGSVSTPALPFYFSRISQIADNKNRREGRFLCCPVLPWKRLGSQDGASGETRTLTLSPETDFESAASTDSATEAMAAQYREAPTVGQSGSWRENTFPVSYAAFRESPHACRRFSFRLARGPDRPSSLPERRASRLLALDGRREPSPTDNSPISWTTCVRAT